MEKLKAQKINEVENNEVVDVKNSPFKIVRKNEKISILCGKVIYHTEFKEIKSCFDWINKKPWEVIALLCEAIITIKENEEEKSN